MIGKGTVTGKTLIDTLTKAKDKLHHIADDLPVHRPPPLRSWPAHPHPRQSEIDGFNAIPSRYV